MLSYLQSEVNSNIHSIFIRNLDLKYYMKLLIVDQLPVCNRCGLSAVINILL